MLRRSSVVGVLRRWKIGLYASQRQRARRVVSSRNCSRMSRRVFEASPRDSPRGYDVDTRGMLSAMPSPRAVSLFWNSTAGESLPWMPFSQQARYGTKMAMLAVTDSPAKPTFLPPLAPAFTHPQGQPLPTCYGEDKMFDGSIRLPRGDVGAQQYAAPCALRVSTFPLVRVLNDSEFVVPQVWPSCYQPRWQQMDSFSTRTHYE